MHEGQTTRAHSLGSRSSAPGNLEFCGRACESADTGLRDSGAPVACPVRRSPRRRSRRSPRRVAIQWPGEASEDPGTHAARQTGSDSPGRRLRYSGRRRRPCSARPSGSHRSFEASQRRWAYGPVPWQSRLVARCAACSACVRVGRHSGARGRRRVSRQRIVPLLGRGHQRFLGGTS